MKLTITILAAMTIATSALAALPADPFQRVATKALRGDFGKLQGWQVTGYKRGLEQGVTANRRLLVTAYLGTEPDGRVDNRGNKCSWRTSASNRIRRGSFVWTKFGLRQVLDCGAKSNDYRADRANCDAWVDYWFPTARYAIGAGCHSWVPCVAAVIE